MAGIDPVSQSLFFSATAEAARQSAQPRKEQKAGGVRKSIFRSNLDRQSEEQRMLELGLPAEIAGMSEEEAVVFLKDRVDSCGDALKHSFNPQNFANFKSAIGNFIRFVERNNYEVVFHRRRGRNKRGRPLEPRAEIRVISQKLDTLASDLIYNQKNNIELLAAVDEIKGLIVDLIAV